RQNIELNVDRLLAGQRTVQFYYQNTEENESTNNSLNTNLSELALTGNVIPGYRATGRASLSYQDRENTNQTTDNKTWEFDSSLRWPLAENSKLITAISFRDQERDTSGVNLDETYETRIGVEQNVSLGRWDGLVRPEFTYRHSHFRNQSSDEWSPSLTLDLRKRTHRFVLDWDHLTQNRSGAGATVRTRQGGLRYTNQVSPDRTFGWELERYDRSTGTNSGESFTGKIFVEWVFSGTTRKGGDYRPTEADELPPKPGQPIRVLTRLRNTPLKEALRILRDQGRTVEQQGQYYVSEGQYLADHTGRQRLFLEPIGDTVGTTGLILDFRRPNNPVSVREQFENVLDVLLQTLGSQDQYREVGELDGDISTKISQGNLQRSYQWKFRDHVIRFGIPSRLDGQARMEIHVSDTLPPLQQSDWSIETIN
ncbi:MAG: hypothetical protein ABEK50_05105, partial [bacterium]